MEKPVIFPVRLDPVSEFVKTDEPCESCGATSTWVVGRPQRETTLCGHCVLYNTQWGSRLQNSIVELVSAVEEGLGRKISDGLQVFPEEADRIVSSIAMTSRLAKARDQKRRASEGSRH